MDLQISLLTKLDDRKERERKTRRAFRRDGGIVENV
jgi:hypothetical protein